LIVSHDRYFMDRLVDHLFVFEGNGIVKDFPGNYTQYRLWQKETDRKELREVAPEETVSRETTVVSEKKNKNNFKEKREFEQLEKEIPQLEEEKRLITEQMSSGSLGFEELQKLSERMIALTTAMEEKEMRWLELSEME
jgi:ATP-binding cassette subfamily F protein uup